MILHMSERKTLTLAMPTTVTGLTMNTGLLSTGWPFHWFDSIVSIANEMTNPAMWVIFY